MANGQAGKGDSRRPRLISREAYSLRWDLAHGDITKKEFDKKWRELNRGNKRKTNGTVPDES